MGLRPTIPPKGGTTNCAFHCFRASQRDMKAPPKIPGAQASEELIYSTCAHYALITEDGKVNQAMRHWGAGAAPRGRLYGRLIGRPLAYARGTVILGFAVLQRPGGKN
jgi:hypothetical protein